jgi:hypothetical protein
MKLTPQYHAVQPRGEMTRRDERAWPPCSWPGPPGECRLASCLRYDRAIPWGQNRSMVFTPIGFRRSSVSTRQDHVGTKRMAPFSIGATG